MQEKELNEIVIVEQLPIIKEKLQIISDEIEQKIKYALSLDCNEETKVEVKNTRAELNKIKTSLEEKRKQVKNAVMQPYESFENVYNDLVKDKLNNADSILKERIDLIENAQKEAKENELRRFVEEYCKANNINIPFESIGLNITLSSSEKSLKEQAKNYIEKVVNDYKLIELEEFKDEILLEYNKCYDFTNSKMKVIERHRLLEEIKKQQDNAKTKQQEEQKIENVVEEIIAPVEVTQEDEIIEVQFTVKGKKSEIKKIKELIINLGLEYK